MTLTDVILIDATEPIIEAVVLYLMFTWFLRKIKGIWNEKEQKKKWKWPWSA